MYARELWAKRSKQAAVLLTKAAVAKLEIIAACGVRRSIWTMKFMRAVLKLQACDACHTSCITRHTSHVTRHTSHVTHYTYRDAAEAGACAIEMSRDPYTNTPPQHC